MEKDDSSDESDARTGSDPPSNSADHVDEDQAARGTKKKSTPKKSKTRVSDEHCDEHIDCPVCLGPAVFPIRIPCGHVFCFLCVKGAARQSNKCPLCRQHIPVDFDKNPTVLEREEINTLDDGYQWFYEGKNGWWQYEKRTSDEIEENHKLNNKKFDLLICGTMYTIDLERNIQFNRDSPNRRRKIKRENANNISVKGVAGVH